MNGLSRFELMMIFLFLCFWVFILITLLLPLSLIWIITRSKKLHNILFDKPINYFMDWLEK